MLYVLMKILSHASAKKADKKAEGFQILPFYGSFSSDMAVNRLSLNMQKTWKGNKSYSDFILFLHEASVCMQKTWKGNKSYFDLCASISACASAHAENLKRKQIIFWLNLTWATCLHAENLKRQQIIFWLSLAWAICLKVTVRWLV